jgi:5'(3')-deoxyribonucleotidase
MHQERLRLFVDMDGTICDIVPKWLEVFYEKINHDLGIKPEDITDYDFKQVIPNEYRDVFVKILFEPGFFLSLKPINGALDILDFLFRSGHQIFFVTKPPISGAETYSQFGNIIADKIRWLSKHIEWFEPRMLQIVFDRSILSGHILFDDYVKNVLNFTRSNQFNKGAVLIARPYNDVDNLPHCVVRSDWNNMLFALLELVKSKVFFYSYVDKEYHSVYDELLRIVKAL